VKTPFLKIGNIKLKNSLILAPMVDVTDLPYRILCRKSGASLAYTEMLYIDSILHENKKTQMLMKTSKDDNPLGLQVTGNNASEFSKLIPYTKQYNLIDINCGCPSIKLIGSQAGSFLLKNPDKIGKMIKILKTSGLPVTAKIRLGFKNNNVIKIAKKIEKSGADALTIHARLAIHGRDIPADWTWINKVKENIGIPVIGNGDIFKGEQAGKMLDICDGAMIARGAIGDPLIFSRILKYLKTGKEPEKDPKENIKQFQQYLKLTEKHNVFDINRTKYLGSNFLKGFQGVASLRQKLMSLKSKEEIIYFIKNIRI